MTRVRVEIQGSADEVAQVLRHLGSAGQHATTGGAGGSTEMPAGRGDDATPATGTHRAAVSHETAPTEWTEALAGEFIAGLEPVGRRMALHVWRAGAAGIHRSALCRSAELTPAELRSLLMRMAHALRRFQRERGLALPRPLVANSPLQSYFVGREFAAVATADAFGDVGRP